MSCPFTSLTCAIRHDGARVLSWTLKPGANYPADFTLQVENSRSGGPWEVLASGITDQCAYIDTRRRNYNKHVNESYRVRLTSESTGENYVSSVCDAGTTESWPFSSEAENVIKQVTQAIKISGCTGVLLKKKTWGAHCPACVDFAGQHSVNEHCPRCLGTGIDGGYYNGLSLSLIKDSIQGKEGAAPEGFSQAEMVTGRCVAYPWIYPGDIWCEDGTNKRYMITDTEDAASYKTTTLVYKIQMHLIELTDVLHTKPATDKVELKDVWDSAKVEYTPESLKESEAESLKNYWDEELSKL